MGINDRLQKEKKSTKTTQKKEPLPWEKDSENAQAVSWEDVDDEVLLNVITTACHHGGSIQFTLSRDGGALGVRVYDDKLPLKTVWADDGETMVDVLQAVIDHYLR